MYCRRVPVSEVGHIMRSEIGGESFQAMSGKFSDELGKKFDNYLTNQIRKGAVAFYVGGG